MQKIDRQFEYREGVGPLRLLGVLCIIMGPLAMWMSFQDDPHGDGIWMFGKGWVGYIPPALAPWAMRIFCFVLIWAGYLMIKGAAQQKKFGGRIAFTPAGLIWEAGPPDGVNRERSYEEISNVRISEAKERKVLNFTRAGAKCVIYSSQMRSVAEFDEMAALMAERAGRKLPLEVPVQA